MKGGIMTNNQTTSNWDPDVSPKHTTLSIYDEGVTLADNTKHSHFYVHHTQVVRFQQLRQPLQKADIIKSHTDSGSFYMNYTCMHTVIRVG